MRNANGTFKKGHRFSKEIRLKMRLSRKGSLNPNWGKVTSEKTKEKMRKKLSGRKLSKEHIQALIDKQKITGNPFKEFLKGLTPIHREKYLIEFGNKISSAFTPQRIREYSLRMLGNTITRDYYKRNPVYTPPNWDDTETGFSVPAFVPLLPERIKPIEATRYYTQGIIPSGISSPFY